MNIQQQPQPMLPPQPTLNAGEVERLKKLNAALNKFPTEFAGKGFAFQGSTSTVVVSV